MKGLRTITRGNDGSSIVLRSKDNDTAVISLENGVLYTTHELVYRSKIPTLPVYHGVFDGDNADNVSFTLADPTTVFATASEDMVFEFDVQFDAAAAGGAPDPVISWSSAADDTTAMYFQFSNQDGTNADMQVSAWGNMTVNWETVNIADNQWHTVSLSLPVTGSTATLTVDGTDYTADSGTVGTNAAIWANLITYDPWEVVLGHNGAYGFTGNIRNVKLSVGANTLIDCADPSTGTNSGTMSDGVVTGVTQGQE